MFVVLKGQLGRNVHQTANLRPQTSNNHTTHLEPLNSTQKNVAFQALKFVEIFPQKMTKIMP